MTSIAEEAYRILDKFDEKVVFYNEQYQDDKYEDAHLKFAKRALNRRSDELRSIVMHPTLYTKQGELYLYTTDRADCGLFYPGDYLYNIVGKLDNTTGPAVVTKQGKTMHFIDGVLHNDNGPAVTFKDQEKDFQVYIHNVNNQLHNDKGPAKEVWKKGILYKKSYYINNQLDNKYGPAIEWSNGQYVYAKEGKKHRLDGPAVHVLKPGSDSKFNDEYWIDGEQISFIEFKIKQIRNNLMDKNKHNTLDKF